MSSLSGAMDPGILELSTMPSLVNRRGWGTSGPGVNWTRLFLLRAFGVRRIIGLTSSSLTGGNPEAATEDTYAISSEGHTVVP